MSHSTRLVQLALLLVLATSAQAQSAPSPSVASKPASSPAAKQWPLADGEVIEIDAKEKRVLLKHGPIRNLGMDPMTMEFLVPDDKLLATLKPGDKVRFAAVWKDGDYVITRIEMVKRRSPGRSRSRTAP